MPTILPSPLLLNSAEEPANGTIATRVTAGFAVGSDLVTRATAWGQIVNGVIMNSKANGPYVIPATPTGVAVEVFMVLKEWRDGRLQDIVQPPRTVSVAAGATIAWDDIVDVVPVLPAGDYITPPWAATLFAAADAASASATAAATSASAANTSNLAVQAVVATTDGLMQTVDANAASAFRVQADARQSATFARLPGAQRNGLTGWFHVDGFGADPTGVADSTAAFQAASDACLADGGGVVYAKAGRYKIAGTIYTHRDNVTSFESTPIAFRGDAGYSSGGTEKQGTTLFKDNAGSIFRVNLNSNGYPWNTTSPTVYTYENDFVDLAFEGSPSRVGETFGISMYRSRGTFRHLRAKSLDGLIVQEQATPAGYAGAWDNYCDQNVYDDIRMTDMGKWGLYLTQNDASRLTRITYTYPGATADVAIKIAYSMGFTIDGLLYSDAAHLAIAPRAFVEVIGSKGWAIRGTHIEHSDWASAFELDSCLSFTIAGVHERFDGKTMFKLTNCYGADLSAFHSWANRAGGTYDILATGGGDISYRGFYLTPHPSASPARAVLVSDSASAVTTRLVPADITAALSRFTRKSVSDADYQMLATDDTISVSSQTVSRTISLPPMSTSQGRVYTVIDPGGQLLTTRTLTIIPNAADSTTVGGLASFVMKTARSKVGVWTNGSAWFVIDYYALVPSLGSTAAAPGAAYVQAEAQAVLTELRVLKAAMRDANLLAL